MAERILVAGLGSFGSAVALKMMEMGHSVCGVDEDQDVVNEAQHHLTVALRADLTSQEAVREIVGAEHYDKAIVAIGRDLESSLQAALYLKEAGVPYIVAKAITPTHGKLLTAIGVDRVLYPEKQAGEQLALELGRKGIIRSLTLAEDVEMVEAVTPSALVGQTLSELALRPKYGITVLAIERDGRFLAPVGAETEIRAGDKLMLFGNPKGIKRLLDRG